MIVLGFCGPLTARLTNASRVSICVCVRACTCALVSIPPSDFFFLTAAVWNTRLRSIYWWDIVRRLWSEEPRQLPSRLLLHSWDQKMTGLDMQNCEQSIIDHFKRGKSLFMPMKHWSVGSMLEGQQRKEWRSAQFRWKGLQSSWRDALHYRKNKYAAYHRVHHFR